MKLLSIALFTAFAIIHSPIIHAERVVGYFIAWGIYGRNYQPLDIPVSKLTHLNYAFANINSQGEIALGDSYADIDKAYAGDVWETTKQPYRGCFWQINRVMKGKYPQLKTLISIGGWTWSAKFSDVALTAASRTKFAVSCAKFLTTYDFDGIDIDWEYPVEGGLSGNTYRPADGANYVLLLKAIRDELDKLPGTKKLLSIASPAGPSLVAHLDVPGMAPLLDFVNIMTYDFRGGWSGFTGHHTPLYPSSTDPDKSLTETSTVVQNFLTKGMPAAKLNIGVAMYGRGWLGAGTAKNGLFQTYKSTPKGSWDDGSSGLTGVFDYKDVKARIASGALTRYWDNEVKAPWAFNPSDGLMISYEDPQSIKEKVLFVKSKSLGGVMFWDLTGDDKGELLNAIFTDIGNQPLTLNPTTGTPPSPPPAPPPTSPPSTPPSTPPSPPPSNPPPPPPASPPSGPTASPPSSGYCPKSGDPCVSGAASICVGAQYAICHYEKWMLQDCASGTVCKKTSTSAVCDWPDPNNPVSATCSTKIPAASPPGAPGSPPPSGDSGSAEKSSSIEKMHTPLITAAVIASLVVIAAGSLFVKRRSDQKEDPSNI